MVTGMLLVALLGWTTLFNENRYCSQGVHRPAEAATRQGSAVFRRFGGKNY